MWDREQDHRSIRSDIIEETYEVVEAIDTDDMTLLREELGDVLFQVMFHSQIEKEKGTFEISDVIGDVIDKMILRHPHVFGEVVVSGTDDVLTNWDAIKRNSKKQKTTTQAMDSVPRELPALMRAAKLQAKAAKAGAEVCSAADYVSAKASALSEKADEKNQARFSSDRRGLGGCDE